MEIKTGLYTIEGSDIFIKIEKVLYKTEDYIKVKAHLFHKRLNIHYERKTYKLYFKNISHWIKVNE